MNSFDVVVVAVAIVVIVMGFSAGLLRSLATILGYLIAAPLAVAIAPLLNTLIAGQHIMPSDPLSSGQAPSSWLVLCITFIAAGIVISALLRAVVGEFAGHELGLFAVLIVVIFDRVIPADRQPQFLANSRLRPYLSAAGQTGLRSLPPEIDDYIGQLRRQRGI
jgi:membrane protein required for colicin V production